MRKLNTLLTLELVPSFMELLLGKGGSRCPFAKSCMGSEPVFVPFAALLLLVQKVYYQCVGLSQGLLVNPLSISGRTCFVSFNTPICFLRQLGMGRLRLVDCSPGNSLRWAVQGNRTSASTGDLPPTLAHLVPAI